MFKITPSTDYRKERSFVTVKARSPQSATDAPSAPRAYKVAPRGGSGGLDFVARSLRALKLPALTRRRPPADPPWTGGDGP
jgi:hypothetical protein